MTTNNSTVSEQDTTNNSKYVSADSQHFKTADSEHYKTADSEHYKTADSEHYKTADSGQYKTADSQLYKTADSEHYKTADSHYSKTPDESAEKSLFDETSAYQKQLFLRELVQTEGCFESPIDICITKSKEIHLEPLQWIHFDDPPKKIKVTNTGLSLIVSAKWKQERPYLHSGPFIGKYVFSNFHLHWGKNAMEGSEHTIDSVKYPAEMHVVTFKSSYLTQEAALKEQDGCATLVYIFKLQSAPNPEFQAIVNVLQDISQPGTSKKLEPLPITRLTKIFKNDYFYYWGAVSTTKCTHYIQWLITRTPIGISADQVDSLRFINDINGNLLIRNFRDTVDSNKRSVFHVNPSSSKYATLLPPNDNILQIYRCEVFFGNSYNKTKKCFNYAIEIKKSKRNFEKGEKRMKKQNDQQQTQVKNFKIYTID